MKLDITKGIQRNGIEMPFELSESFPEDSWNGDTVRFAEPVTFSGTYMISEETVIIRGIAETVIEGPCARCLETARMPVRTELSEAYVRDKGEEIIPLDEEQYRYQGHILDLYEAVRTALLLELPTQFLCKEDCKGLCPVCGTNLNYNTCSCQKDIPRRNPFSALAAMLNEDEEV
ncbi:MAG: DUF177 domain-containing protein [Clostridia bacterium]|nr:DUF177 domain-containing protein [Clostridia bacterium]